MKIVILNPLEINIDKYLNNEILKKHKVIYNKNKVSDQKKIKELIKDADIILSDNTILKEETLKVDKKLKAIFIAFSGIDHLPLSYLKNNNIKVFNASSYSSFSVSELTLMFILMSLRKYNELSYKNRVKGKELSSLTIGLIGMGNIAKEVVNILSSLNTNRNNNRNNKILYTSNSRHLEIENNPNISIKFVSKETLLKNSDIISLHIPLNDNNLNYINENEFSLMKNDAILINTARGKLVNKEALIKKIKENSNFIYASDVFEKEPPLEDNYDLLNFKNVLITPHIGFYTFEAMEKRAEIIFNKLFDYLKKNEN